MSYRVVSGDTMSSIAARHGVSLRALESVNPQVRNANVIQVGERLNIPGQSDSYSGSSYTVHSGDTMSGIASRHGVSLHALEAANPQVRNANLIRVGERLNIPGRSTVHPPTPTGGLYVVHSGDTMSSIASRHGVSLHALEAANPQVTNPNVIQVGQHLNLPAAGGSHPAPAPSPTPTGGGARGTNAASIAHSYLGESEYQLQPSGKLDMDQWVPKTEDCANFVSGVLEKGGLISHGQRSDNVVGLANNLQAAGWHYVPNSQAKPGDVVTFDGPGGNSQHVEIFDHWSGSTPVFIGSNNVMSDGTQKISYDVGGTWAYRWHVLAPPGSSSGSAPSSGGGGGSYTVQRGDTMSSIASRHGVSLGALEAANPQVTNPNVIQVGERLNLPGSSAPKPTPKPTPKPAPRASTYTVRSGDTMSSIASRAGVSLGALEAANPRVTNPNVISVGEKLNLPAGAKAPSGPTGPTGSVGGTVGQWIAQAQKVLAAHGVPYSKMNAQDIDTIIMHESSGNPNAENDWDSNAKAGHPSIGLMQTIGPTFDAYHLPGYDNIRDPVSNIIAGVRYAISRYGSISSVPGVIKVKEGLPYVGY